MSQINRKEEKGPPSKAEAISIAYRSHLEFLNRHLSYPNHYLAEMADEHRISLEALRELGDQPGGSSPAISKSRQWFLAFIILLGLFFSTLDTSIVSTSLVTISHDLNDFSNAQWVMLAYMLTYMGFSVGFARLSDTYSRRSILIVAWVIFCGFSLGCGFATTMLQLAICRAFQGLGASGLYSLAQISLVEIGPGAGRPEVNGILIPLTLCLSFILGPILGGAISSRAGWKWIFFVNVPFGIFAVPGLFLLWPLRRGQLLNRWRMFRSIDFAGNILLLAASVLLVFGLQQGGSMSFQWDSAVVTTTLTVAGICWLIFCVWEAILYFKFDTIQPIFPIAILGERVLVACLLSTLFAGFPYLALVITLPERFQIVNGDSPITAGLRILPLLGTCAFGCLLGGSLNKKKNLSAYTLTAGSLFMVLGTGLLLLLRDSETISPSVYGFQTIFGLGVGLSLSSATMIATLNTSRQYLAATHGAVAQVRVLGGAIALTICTIIFNARVQKDLVGNPLLTASELDALHRSPTAALDFPPAARAVVRTTYAAAFTEQMQAMVVFAGLAFLACLLAWERDPVSVQESMARHKDFANQLSETELDDVASVQSSRRS